MSNDKRPRGRPRGTGKNDEPYLAQVAELLIREPSLKPTTAMKRVMMRHAWPETDETLIRRWQVKWKAIGLSLLAAVLGRMRPTLPAVPTEPAWVLANRIMKQVEDSPLNQMMRQIEDSPLSKMMRQIEDSPLSKMMRQIEDSPLSKMMRQAEDSPLSKMMRQIEDSPLSKMMRQAEDSPLSKIMKQQARRMG